MGAVKKERGLVVLAVGALLLCAPLAGLGCSGAARGAAAEAPSAPRAASEPRLRHGNLDLSGYSADAVDLRFDGEGTVISYHRRDGTLAVRTFDLDFDGQPEVLEHFDASGVLIERELVLDHERGVDIVQYFEGGVMTRRDLRVGYADDLPIRFFYDATGSLQRVERDSRFRGQIDLWEYYEEGRLVRTGMDLNGNGRPDVFQSHR